MYGHGAMIGVFSQEGDIMKKILKINAVLTILFSSLLIFFTYKNNDTTYWNNWGYADISQELFLRNTGYSGDDLYTMLTTLSKEKKVNMIKTDYLSEKGETKIVKSIYVVDEEDHLFMNNSLIDGKWIDTADMDKEYFLSTKEIDHPNCIGTLFDPFYDDYVEIRTLQGFRSERGSLDGDYILRATNMEYINDFMKELSIRSGIPMDELTTKSTFVSQGASPIAIMCSIALIICFISFALLSTYYAVNSIKKIGVMKLNGYSSLEIWKSLILDIMITMVGM